MERSDIKDTADAVRNEPDLEERAAIAKENLPFLDDETATLTAADQMHTGKINPASRVVDDARSREAQADDKNT